MTNFRAGRAGAALLFAVITLWSVSAQADPLITDDEAQRPNDPKAAATRSITRGPTVRFEIPDKAVESHRPFDFKVHFDAHGGSTVDPNSVRVIYLKTPNVDLTSRLKPYISATGIDMTKAEVPPGEHLLKVEVKDSDGREGEALYTMDVPK